MFKRTSYSVVVVAALIAAPFAYASFSTSNPSPPCVCCGDRCACVVCNCDADGCACDTGGNCVCSADCCTTCCAE